MFGLGTGELILIFVVVLIFFGVGKLPKVGEDLGKAIKNLKKGVSEADILEADRKENEIKR